MLLSRKKVLSTSATIRALSVGITATGLLIAMDMAGHEEDKDGMKRKTVSIPPRYFGSLTSISGIAPINTRCDEFRRVPPPPSSRLRKRKTVEMFEHTASEGSLESKYSVQWQKPLAEGAFGVVYQATNLETGEEVAVKKISKQLTDHAGFQREMDALMHLRENGGHPNICGLRENFDEDGYYYVVLDLITGGEMFDHLISKGAYSEADAARLIREIASALAFLHGIGVVHGDMKPENLMLSSQLSSAAVIKVVDFGCAQVENYSNRKGVTSTLAYCPPEYLDKKKRGPCIHPPFDMWALGVILYIMLTGGHPFDLYGDASDADVVLKVLSGQKPPLQNSPFTAHLSADAVNVIESLLQWNPDKRPTAQQLLQDPWVLGEKARRDKIANSGKRLSTYRAFTTKLEAKVFADMVSLSNTGKMDEEVKRTSLIERAFHLMEPDGLGFVTSASLRKLTDDGDSLPIGEDDEGLSLSKFEDLLSENLKNRYFPKDFVVYNEGDVGDSMYFINSGTVQVFSKDGFQKTLGKNDFFGEGALLNPKKIRSASIRCVTPVHAIEVSREYFEKYLASSDEDVKQSLREIDMTRRKQQADTIIGLQKRLRQNDYSQGDTIFSRGEAGKALYILEEGKVDLSFEGNVVFSIRPGEMFGEQSLYFRRPCNVSATCKSPQCRLQVLGAREFYSLLEVHPTLKENVRDICLRRDFQKALCFTTKKGFPTRERELRTTFNFLANQEGVISHEDIRSLVLKWDPEYAESDIAYMFNRLDLDESGAVSWAEFKRIFGMQANE